MRQDEFRLRITKQAQVELESIFDYIANQLNSPLAAIKTIDKIEKKFNDILAFPFIGAEMGKAYTKCQNYRRCIVERYSIFYKISGKTIIIAAVQHQKQSLRNLPDNQDFET